MADSAPSSPRVSNSADLAGVPSSRLRDLFLTSRSHRTLHQGLSRLEGRELIAAEWGITENGRRARYYKVTSRGKAHLKQETATWVRYTETVTGILTGPQEA